MNVRRTVVSLLAGRLGMAVLLCGAAALPLGLSFAQEADDLDRVVSWLEQGVNSAFLSREQADIMLAALRRSSAVSRAVAIDVSQATRSPASFDRAAFERIMQQFTTGQITAEQANEQALALGLLTEGASLTFVTEPQTEGNSTPQIRSFTLVKDSGSDDFESQQIKIFATGVETAESDSIQTP